MFVSKRLARASAPMLGLLSALAFADPVVVEEHALSTADAPPPHVPAPAPATSSPAPAPAETNATPADNGGGSGGNTVSNWDLYQQVQALQQQVQSLQGTVDEQAHTIEHLRNDAKNRYTDLDQRLNTLSDRVSQQQAAGGSAGAAAPAATSAASVPSGNIDEEKKAYLAAYQVFRTQTPDKAIPPMLAFVGRYPDSIFTPNAYYWLGEFYLAATPSNPAEARRHFETVLSKYPDSAKAPAALYKLGTIDDLQNHPDAARKHMQELIQRFPKSQEASLAQSYLNPPAATDETPPAAPATSGKPAKKKKTGG